MTRPLSPDHIETLMVGYVFQDLTPEELEEFEGLLQEDSQLFLEVQRLQETLDVLPYGLPEVEPPAHLRQAILDAASASDNPPQIRKIVRLSWSKIISGVAALIALVVGLDNYRLRQQLNTAQNQQTVIAVLRQPNTRLFSLTGTDKASSAFGNIAINAEQQKAVIIFKNLPSLPDDQIYRLWAIIDNQKIACANFTPSQQGTVLEEISLPTNLCSLTQSTLAVTQEPLPSPPQPVGPAIMLEKT